MALPPAQTVSAQSVPTAPTREEIKRRPPSDRTEPTRVVVEGELERSPCALDDPRFADVRLTVRDVAFDGMEGVDPALLRPAYAADLGQERPVSVVCDIRDRASAELRKLGYIAAVQVPEQSVADGRLRFTVVLAKLVDVRVLGDAGGARDRLSAYLERLREQPVFNRFQAERYLLLASDLPGYQVRLALRPAGTAPGDVVGEVTVLRMPLSIDANVQNYGSKELGRTGAQVRAQLFGLTGLGDATSLSFYTTVDLREQQTLQFDHEFRVGSQGLTFGGGVDYAWAHPDTSGSDNIDARTLVAGVWAAYPFLLRQDRSLRGWIGADLVNQLVKQDGDRLTRDRLRTIYARLAWDAIGLDARHPEYSIYEPRWRAGASVELRKGVDIFGASSRCDLACQALGGTALSRDDGDPTAALVRGSAYAEYRLVPKVTLAAGARGQYSGDTVLSYEEFAAGNYTIGRGYDPGALLGSRGFGLQGELRVGSLVPKTARAIAAEPYAFLDYARVSNPDTDLLPRGQRALLSTGLGVRANWRLFSIDTSVAFPLERTGFSNDKPGPRLLFSVSRRLWPWSP